MPSNSRSLMFWLRSLLLPLALLGLAAATIACGGSAPSNDTSTEVSAEDAAPEEPQEPAQFRDGFESGDTSGWSGEGDGSDTSDDDASTTDTPPTGDS